MLGIELWRDVDPTSLPDLQLALALSVPLQLANLAILAPSFGGWQLPTLKPLQVGRVCGAAVRRAGP